MALPSEILAFEYTEAGAPPFTRPPGLPRPRDAPPPRRGAVEPLIGRLLM